MISWIQNHLIRHGRWVFLTLLTVVIVAFVFTIGNTPGCTTNQSGYEKQSFYNYDLNSSYEMEILGEKVSLSVILDTGRPIQNDQQFQLQIMSRIALLHLADELGLPAPSEKSLARYIQSKAAFRGPDGQFSNDAYTRFIDNIESNPNIRQGLLSTVLEENYRIEQVKNSLSGPGYFLPSEALSQVQLSETSLKMTLAEISYSEFTPEVIADEDRMLQFYTNNLKRYEVSERIKAHYVKFDINQYAGSVGPFSEEELREHFLTNRARFVAAYQAAQPKIENRDAEEPLAPTATFEDVRSDVTMDLTAQTTERLTNKAAQKFALTLYRNSIQLNTPAFQELLNKSNLEMIEIPPYTMEESRASGLPVELLESAFVLNETRYFSDAYKIKDGFGVLILSDRLPSEIPPYETVIEKVRIDYKAEEKRRLFNEKGKQLKNEIAAFLETGIEFAQAAETLGLKVTENEAFKIDEAPRTINQAALQSAKGMQEGELSPMITSGDSGLFVYINAKDVPEIQADDEKLVQAETFLKRYGTSVSFNALINELITQGIAVDTEKE